MTLAEELWRQTRPFLKSEDAALEHAFHRFGGAREWVVRQLALPSDAHVLEVGYGQGLFTVELAARLDLGKVTAVDKLSGPYVSGAVRWYARIANFLSRIDLVRSDALRLPFRDDSFDAAASFLGLQDIVLSRGLPAIDGLLQELNRVVRPRGVIGIADDSFPESRPRGMQGQLFDAIHRHWRTLLPSTADLRRALEGLGVTALSTRQFVPEERLRPEDAERELRVAVDGARAQGGDVDFEAFWDEAGDIVRQEGRRYSAVVHLAGTVSG